METITAANTNCGFSNLLEEISKGDEFVILSRAKPVIKINSVDPAALNKDGMKNISFLVFHDGKHARY